MAHDERYGGLQQAPPKRARITTGSLHRPVYFNFARLTLDLQREKDQVRRHVLSHSYSAKSVLTAVEHVKGQRWQDYKGSRYKAAVAFKEELAGAMRTLTPASYPDIAALIGGVHSSAHMAYQRWLKRPHADRDIFIRSVRATLDRI